MSFVNIPVNSFLWDCEQLSDDRDSRFLVNGFLMKLSEHEASPSLDQLLAAWKQKMLKFTKVSDLFPTELIFFPLLFLTRKAIFCQKKTQSADLGYRTECPEEIAGLTRHSLSTLQHVEQITKFTC